MFLSKSNEAVNHNRDNPERRTISHLRNMQKHFPNKEVLYKTEYLDKLPSHPHHTCKDGFAAFEIYEGEDSFYVTGGHRIPFAVFDEFIHSRLKPLNISFYFKPLPDHGRVCIIDTQGSQIFRKSTKF